MDQSYSAAFLTASLQKTVNILLLGQILKPSSESQPTLLTFSVSAHADALLQLRAKLGIETQSQCNVSQRSGSDQGDFI